VKVVGAAVLMLLLHESGKAQLSESETMALSISRKYRIVSNVTYLKADNWEAKLDVYAAAGSGVKPVPTLIYFHGGGWQGSDRIAASLSLVPFMALGWNVVNVDYRLTGVSLAPAAVEDCRCALRWVTGNAKQYGFDTKRIVVSGISAGGHLALMTGMAPMSAGLDRRCVGRDELKVAAIINWCGITDVADLLEGPNMQAFAVSWLGSSPNREALAKQVSPLTYVRPGLPPILTIHGDQDPSVPYAHATRLHEALSRAGVSNRLVPLPGAKHGNYSQEETIKAYEAIEQFLKEHALLSRSAN
jgi:acetyl esterase/lipase